MKMYTMWRRFQFSFILLLMPFVVKCELFHWNHMLSHYADDYSEDLCFDNRNCASRKHCIDNECRCIGAEMDFHVGKTCFKERNSGEKCELTLQCPLFERCFNGTCQCEQDYVETMWEGCKPRGQLDDLCSVDEQCLAAHSVCTENKCKCSSGYGETMHNSCEPEFTTVKVYAFSNDGKETDPHDEVLHMLAREFGQMQANRNSLLTKEITYKNPNLKTEVKRRGKRNLSFDINSALANINIPGVNIQGATTRPVPKLDQACTRTSDCKTVKNAICKSKSCKCKSGWVKKPGNNRQCFKKRNIGQSCSFKQQCGTNARCHSRKCKCNVGNVQITPQLCAPTTPLNQFCRYNQQCTGRTPNSICSGGKCKCQQNFVEYQSSCLAKVAHNQPCQQVQQCPRNSVCQTICKCKANHVYILNIGCLPELNLGETCAYSEQCQAIVSHSECDGTNTCACQSGYVPNGNECLPTVDIGEACTIPAQCVANAGCGADRRCRCNTNFYECNNKCLAGKPLGQACECGSQCITPDSVCDSNTCACSPGYVQCSSSCLLPKSIGEDCTCNAQCSLANSICYNGQKCWCQDGYQYSNGQCTPKSLGTACATSLSCTASDLFSECQGNSCVCSATYTENAKQQCEADSVAVGGSCSTVAECQRNDRYSTCGTSGQCECLPSFNNVQGVCTKIVATVGSPCSTCIECLRGNPGTECSDAGQCVCSEAMGSKPDPSNANNCLPKDCGATHSSVSSPLTVTSPSLSDGYYWNNANCVWTLTTTSTAFKIEIVSYSSEAMDYPEQCVLDYTTITNNNDCTIDLCGDYDAGTTIYVSGSTIEITFKSDEKYRKVGFEFTVTPVDVSTIPSNCNAPTRNNAAASWTEEQCFSDPADVVNFETEVLGVLFPQWNSV